MRKHLHPELIEAMDHANLYALLQRATCQCANSFVDIRETSPNSGVEIELVQMTVDNKAVRESYCMSFVQSIVAYVEKRMNVTSRMFASEHVMTVWNNTPDKLRSNVPVLGSIVIYNHKGTAAGHCGVVTGFGHNMFITVEANTNSGDTGFSKGNEGEGIYQKNRPHGHVGDMLLVGFILPFRDYQPII